MMRTVRLAHYYLGQDEPGKSERHVEAAVRLHPRDERTVTLRWCQRVTMIRCLAQQRQFAAADQELEQAAAAVPDNVEPYTVPLIRTGLALKAKQTETAQVHLSAALATVEEPTAIWMQMSLRRRPVQIARGGAQRLRSPLQEGDGECTDRPDRGSPGPFLLDDDGTLKPITLAARPRNGCSSSPCAASNPIASPNTTCRMSASSWPHWRTASWQLRKKFITQGARQFPGLRLPAVAGRRPGNGAGPLHVRFRDRLGNTCSALWTWPRVPAGRPIRTSSSGAEGADAAEQLDAIPRYSDDSGRRRVRRGR